MRDRSIYFSGGEVQWRWGTTKRNNNKTKQNKKMIANERQPQNYTKAEELLPYQADVAGATAAAEDTWQTRRQTRRQTRQMHTQTQQNTQQKTQPQPMTMMVTSAAHESPISGVGLGLAI